MGQLLTIEMVNQLGPAWYFPDLNLHDRINAHGLREREITSLTMFADPLYETIDYPLIRRFVEEQCSDAVIFEYWVKSYFYAAYRDAGRQRWNTYDGHQVHVRWLTFWFINSDDAISFKLRFNHWIREITDLHPHRMDDRETGVVQM